MLLEKSIGSPLVCPRTNAPSLTPTQQWPPLPPVSGPLPECNCTGCCERKLELNKALVELGDQQCLFLSVNEGSLAARNPRWELEAPASLGSPCQRMINVMIYGSCYLRLQSRGDRCVQPGSVCGLIESQVGVQIHSPLLPMAEIASWPFRCRNTSFGWQTFWGPPLCLGQGFQSWLEGKNLIVTSKKEKETSGMVRPT